MKTGLPVLCENEIPCLRAEIACGRGDADTCLIFRQSSLRDQAEVVCGVGEFCRGGTDGRKGVGCDEEDLKGPDIFSFCTDRQIAMILLLQHLYRERPDLFYKSEKLFERVCWAWGIYERARGDFWGRNRLTTPVLVSNVATVMTKPFSERERKSNLFFEGDKTRP